MYLTMSHLPSLQSLPSRPEWDASTMQRNVQQAAQACEVLKGIVQNAVYLDEEAYSGAANIAAYEEKIRAQQRRAHNLTLEMEALRAEVMAKDVALAAAHAKCQEQASQLSDQQQVIDSNEAVFRLHYQELQSKDEEISRLRAMVGGAGGSHGEPQHQLQQQQQQDDASEDLQL